jgi:hypothetical protein
VLRGTLSHLGGGQTLFDRQSPQMPKDESELGEKLPELFDIHVMFFADTSNEAITALQRAFSLERSVAEKLIADAPVMVKRAVSPEVADSLLDVLNNLGAQVVLLPSTAAASVVPDDAAGNLLSGGGPIWGGLELKAPTQIESSTRLPNAQVVSLGRRDPQSVGAGALQAESPSPKAAGHEPDGFAPDPAAASLELDLDEISEPRAAGRTRSVPNSEADLGLGSVPPLPSASAARPAIPRPPPPRVAKSAPAAVVKSLRSGALPEETTDQSAVLPDLQLAVPDSGDAFWSAKRKSAGKGRDGGDATAARATTTAKQDQTRSQPPRGSIPAAEVSRSRTFALAALIGGVLVFAVSDYFDQSIFSGSANPLWIVVQGFGFLGVGTGCARIRR